MIIIINIKEKKDQEEELIKPQTPEASNKKDEEEAVIQEDETQKVLLRNVSDSSDKLDQYNSKGDLSNNLRQSKSYTKFFLFAHSFPYWFFIPFSLFAISIKYSIINSFKFIPLE